MPTLDTCSSLEDISCIMNGKRRGHVAGEVWKGQLRPKTPADSLAITDNCVVFRKMTDEKVQGGDLRTKLL